MAMQMSTVVVALPHGQVAHVVMGEPDEEYKKAQMDNLLKEKQEKAGALPIATAGVSSFKGVALK